MNEISDGRMLVFVGLGKHNTYVLKGSGSGSYEGYIAREKRRWIPRDGCVKRGMGEGEDATRGGRGIKMRSRRKQDGYTYRGGK